MTSFPLSHCPVLPECTVRRPGNEHDLDYEWHVVHLDWRQLSDYSSPSFLLPPQEPSVSALKQQLVTLTAALATLTEEKSKMEANFQMDKRAMLVRVCLWYDSPQNTPDPLTPTPSLPLSPATHTHTHTHTHT